MNLFGKRPLALFCVAFAAAAVCGAFLTVKHIGLHLLFVGILCLWAALLWGVPLFLHRFHARLLTPILALVFAALALFQSWLSVNQKLEVLSELSGQNISCTIHIKEKYFSKSYLSSYRVEINELGSSSFKTQGTVTLPFDAEWEIGDVVTGNFFIYSALDDAENASYLLSDGRLLQMETEEKSFSVVDHVATDKLTATLYDLREALSNLICEQIADEEGHLVSSLFLNKRELLESGTVRDFRRTGTTHLLAISGMHLSLVILFADTLLRIFCVKKKGRCVAVLLTTLFYLALTGFALSACRAFLMCCFVYLSWLFQSDNDAIISLFFSLFFILALSPLSVYDVGMWMSVLAVLGILIAMQYLDRWRERLHRKGRKPKKLRRLFSLISAICISLAAELFILFPMWLVFDELSLVALPCGILLSLPVTAILFLTPIILLLSWLPALGTLLGHLLYLICHIILKAVAYFSTFRGITVSLEHRFFDFFIPIFSFVILLLLIVKLKGRWHIPAAMGSALLSILLFLCILRIPKADTIIADFTQTNDSGIFVFSTDEASVICDLTSGSYSAIRSSHEILSKRYSTEISAYVLTHYHTNHINSISRLFSSYIVRALYLPMPQTDAERTVFTALLTLTQKHKITAVIYDRGAPISLGELSIEISNEAYLKRSTHPTFYLTASAFGKSLIYVSESLHEDKVLYQELCQKIEEANALIFGLHGPITKEAFSYPLGDGYVFLTDSLLLDYFAPQDKPIGKILCDTTQISLPLQREKRP